MLKRLLTLTLVSIGSTAYANQSSALSFLDQLDSLAKTNENQTLQKSIQRYYKTEPEVKQGKYPSLLHDAAIMGNLFLLRYLVDTSIRQVDYAYQDGPTPLGYIAGDNQIKSAKLLLELRADPNNVGNTQGAYPLAAAVVSGNMEMMRLLLDYGAEVHAGAYFQSPLGLTMERNDIEILQLFHEYDFKLDSMDDELRIIVIEYLNSELVEEEFLKIIKSHGFDIHQKTEEKASFFEEYKDQIKFVDVKQMLQDIYQLESVAEVSEHEESSARTTEVEAVSDNAGASNTDESSSLQINEAGTIIDDNESQSQNTLSIEKDQAVTQENTDSGEADSNNQATKFDTKPTIEASTSVTTSAEKNMTDEDNNLATTIENTDTINNNDDKMADSNAQNTEATTDGKPITEVPAQKQASIEDTSSDSAIKVDEDKPAEGQNLSDSGNQTEEQPSVIQESLGVTTSDNAKPDEKQNASEIANQPN